MLRQRNRVRNFKKLLNNTPVSNSLLFPRTITWIRGYCWAVRYTCCIFLHSWALASTSSYCSRELKRNSKLEYCDISAVAFFLIPLRDIHFIAYVCVCVWGGGGGGGGGGVAWVNVSVTIGFFLVGKFVFLLFNTFFLWLFGLKVTSFAWLDRAIFFLQLLLPLPPPPSLYPRDRMMYFLYQLCFLCCGAFTQI